MLADVGDVIEWFADGADMEPDAVLRDVFFLPGG
jgi:hypothetical protein